MNLQEALAFVWCYDKSKLSAAENEVLVNARKIVREAGETVMHREVVPNPDNFEQKGNAAETVMRAQADQHTQASHIAGSTFGGNQHLK